MRSARVRICNPPSETKRSCSVACTINESRDFSISSHWGSSLSKRRRSSPWPIPLPSFWIALSTQREMSSRVSSGVSSINLVSDPSSLQSKSHGPVSRVALIFLAHPQICSLQWPCAQPMLGECPKRAGRHILE